MKKILQIISYTFIFTACLVLIQTSIAQAQTATPTTQNLQYTGSYCKGFKGTLQTGSSNIADVLKFGTCLINTAIVPLLLAIAILVFVYGIVKFIGSEESAEKEDGKQFMMWGIIALAVMFSVWGIVKILGNTFGVTNIIPSLPANK